MTFVLLQYRNIICCNINLYNKRNSVLQKFLLRFSRIARLLLYFSTERKIPEGRTDRQYLRITTWWSFEDWGLQSERSNHERFHSCHPRWRTSGVPFRGSRYGKIRGMTGRIPVFAFEEEAFPLEKIRDTRDVGATRISRELIDRPPDVSIFNRSHCVAIRNNNEREKKRK